MKFCTKCGTQMDGSSQFCTNCGNNEQAPNMAQQGQQFNDQNFNIPPGYQQKSKLAAGLLQIFLGGFGVGRFYLGYTKIGVIQLVVTLVTCGAGSIWGLVDGIMIITGNPNVDAEGVPLKE